MRTKIQRNLDIPTKKPGNFSVTEKTDPAKPIKNPLLDINANFAAKPVNTGVSKETFDLYRLRDEAAKELPYLRVCKCGKVPYKPLVTIDRNEKNITRFGNVSHCGSIWTCPVCAYKKMKIRQEQVRDIFKLHSDSGCSFYFVTLTVKHGPGDPLTVLLNKVTRSWSEMTEERGLRPLFKKSNFIQTLEIRYSKKTGWHPHLHIVFMTNEVEIKPLFEKLITSWTKKTDSKEKGQKVVDSTGEETLSKYLAKMSLADEMTEGSNKKSKKGDSFSYFEMLKDVKQFSTQIREFGYATKGCQSLRKSRGLNITKDKDKDTDTVKENLLNIEKTVYVEKIVKGCDYKLVLSIAENWPAIFEYFKDYDIDRDGKTIFPIKRQIRIKKEPVLLSNRKDKGIKEFRQHYRRLYDKMTGKITRGRPANRKNMNPNFTLNLN